MSPTRTASRSVSAGVPVFPIGLVLNQDVDHGEVKRLPALRAFSLEFLDDVLRRLEDLSRVQDASTTRTKDLLRRKNTLLSWNNAKPYKAFQRRRMPLDKDIYFREGLTHTEILNQTQGWRLEKKHEQEKREFVETKIPTPPDPADRIPVRRDGVCHVHCRRGPLRPP